MSGIRLALLTFFAAQLTPCARIRAKLDSPALLVAVPEGVRFGSDGMHFGAGAAHRLPRWMEQVRPGESSRLIYDNVWPGIRVEFYTHNDQFEYDVVLRPGADIRLVSFSFSRSEKPKMLPDGELRVGTSVFSAPKSFSEGKPVASRYVLRSPGNVGFEAAWDGRTLLRIDPTLVQATANPISTTDQQGWTWSPDYINPTFGGGFGAVLVPSTGGILFAGQTKGSSGLRYPILFGPPAAYGGPAAYVALRTATSSTGFVFGVDSNITALAEDPAGGYLAAGMTYGPLPVTSGLFQTQMAGSIDGFLMHLPSDLSKPDWITYLDGGIPSAMAVDSSGNIYLTGLANSGKPYVAGSYKTPHPGGKDLFVLKLSHDGAHGIFSAIVGGTNDDTGIALAIAPDGSVVLGGTTDSPDLGIPKTALQTSISAPGTDGFTHGFIVRLSADGSSLAAGTYLGGSRFDEVRFVGVLANGDILVSGITSSSDFPFKSQLFGDITQIASYLFDGFMARLNGALTGETYSEALAGAPIIDARLSPGDNYLFAISPTPVPNTPDALMGPGAYINLIYGPTLLEFDPANGHLIYSGGLGRSNPPNYGGAPAPMIATAANDLVAVAGLSQNDATPITANGETSVYPAAFLQEFQFGDASPTQNTVSVYGLSPSSSPVTGSLAFGTPRRAITITPSQTNGQGVLSIQTGAFALPGAMMWTAVPSSVHGLTTARVQYAAHGGTVQQAYTDFLIFTDQLQAEPSSVHAAAVTGSPDRQITLSVSANAGLPFSVSGDQPWIHPSITGAVSPAQFTVTLHSAGLEAGTWTGNILLAANGLSGDTLTIPVEFTLLPHTRKR